MLKDRTKRTKPNRDDAEAMAATALAWMASDEDRISRFLALSGLGLDDLRAQAGDTGMLAEVLGHLLTDEPALLAFAADNGLSPETVVAAEALLRPPGGDW